MAEATSPTRQKYPLSPRKIIKKTIVGSLALVIMYLILAGVALYIQSKAAAFGVQIRSSWFSMGYLLGFGLVVLNIVWNWIYQTLYFNSYNYDLNESFIVIKKGVIMPKEISIPYERVQDVYVDQDFWDRVFALYDVHLSTATWTSGMEAHIDGVGKGAADGLRQVLLQTIGEKIHRKPTETAQNPNGSLQH